MNAAAAKTAPQPKPPGRGPKQIAVTIAKAAGGAAIYAALTYLHAHYPAFFPQ